MIRKIILPTCLTFLLLVEIFLIKGIPVLKETFPLENTEAVLFTLSQNIEGSRTFVITLFAGLLQRSVMLTAAIASILFSLHIIKKKFFSYKVSKIFVQ